MLNWALFSIILTACQDKDETSIQNRPPTVGLGTHASIFNEGDAVQVVGYVQDDVDTPESMLVEWAINDVPYTTVMPDESGQVLFESEELESGEYILTLTATDSSDKMGVIDTSFVVNGLPTQPSIGLSPDPVYTTDTVQVDLLEEATDPESDAISYQYTWYLEGAVQSEFNTDTLPSTSTEYGQSWRVEVWASDPYGSGPKTEASFEIANTPPTIADVSIQPGTMIYNDQTLTCSSTVNDPDEHLEATYEWFSNNSLLGEGESLDLSEAVVNPTDSIDCIASVTDTAGDYTELSSTVTIDNRPPTITSLTINTSGDVLTNSVLTCSVVAEDLDGLPLSIEYSWLIDGTNVLTGDTITLTPTLAAPESVVECMASIDDGFGGTAQESVAVTVGNQPPVLTSVDIQYTDLPTSTSLMTCHTVASDADLQSFVETYVWQNDASGMVLPSSTDTVQLTPSLVGPNDTVSCTVTLNDGIDDSNTITATTTIQNTPPTFTDVAQLSTTGLQVGDTWTCAATGVDQDDGSLLPTYTWQDDTGTNIGSGTSLPISALNSTPEESIYCIATLQDNQGLSVSSSTSETVLNTAPIISSVEIDQSEVYTNDTISVFTEYSDADDNNDTSILLEWYVIDGAGQASMVQTGTDDTLDGTLNFSKGQQVQVQATVTDAFTSTTVLSPTVEVLNSPPSVSGLTIGPNVAYADYDDLTCTAVGADDDGDTLTYSVEWTNTAGMTHTDVNLTTPSSTLDASMVTNDDWTCAVTITDGTASTTASTTMTVEPSACDGVTCGPDGTCNNFGSTYTCTCRAGFEGTNCELDIDECATNNGGCTGTRSDCVNTMGGHYCIDANTVTAFPETSDAAADTYYNVAVVTVNAKDAFPSDPADYVSSSTQWYRQDWYDTDMLGDLIFEHPDGVKSFFNDISYGNANFQGVVLDWYEDYATESTADDIFNDRDFYLSQNYDKFDPTQFDFYMIVGLADTGFIQRGWGMGNSVPAEGGGRLQNKGLTYLINSTFFNTAGQTRFGGWVLPSVPWVHEVFHTIGIFGHSNTLWCYPTLVDYQNATTADDVYFASTESLSDVCDIKGYGDPFSLMGERLWATHPSVASKLEMDWIPEDNKTELDATGVFFEEVVELYPHNLPTLSNNVAIQITVPEFEITTTNGTTKTFDRVTLETRIEDGFDTYLSALGTGYRDYSSVMFRYLEASYSWNSQYSTGIYDLIYPIDLLGALVYLDSSTDSNEAVYLIDGNPASDGVIADYSSPKGHLGNAGKFANAMFNVGSTLSSDLLPFTIAVETGPDNGVNGEVSVRITPVQ